MVALSVAFYARLSVGSRQIVEIFNILNEFMGNVFGKVPAYTTIGYWTQELGLSVYKESCSLFKDKRYALIVDESMMIGSEKLLLTLAMPAANAGSAITEKDVTIVDISIAKSWNGTSIKNVLEKVADKIGHKPEYVISDNGFTVCKAVRDAGYAHHSDISHTLGMFLERVYKKEADFQELSYNVQLARFKYNMQDVAYVQPPSQRSIARFMNMSKWIDWISRMQYLYHTLRDDIKSIYAFIPHNADNVFAKIGDVQKTAILLFAEYIDAATTIAAQSGGGGGGATSGWGRDKDEDELSWAYRCAMMANRLCSPRKKQGYGR